MQECHLVLALLGSDTCVHYHYSYYPFFQITVTATDGVVGFTSPSFVYVTVLLYLCLCGSLVRSGYGFLFSVSNRSSVS